MFGGQMSIHDSDDPWTYFGLWPSDQIKVVSELLNSLSARYEIKVTKETEEDMKNWEVWNPLLADPFLGHYLWIHDEDLEKVGDFIVKLFPYRKYGAERWT